MTADGIRMVKLEDTDHYIVMKEFLNNREGMLRELLKD